MKIVVIVQARSGSSRLPGKIMKTILGRPVLMLQMERMLAARLPDSVVVATTAKPEDDEIYNYCKSKGLRVFRGHPTDLLDRHYKAGLEFGAEVAVKIPSDCPLIDPAIIDRTLQFYMDNAEKFDFVSNLHPPTYPDGNDVEVIPMEILRNAWEEAEKKFELEHTTPYIWDNPHKFRIGNVEWETGLDYSMSHRFTIDYNEDYEFIKRVYEELYPENKLFRLGDILNLLEQKPEIKEINAKHTGVNWYRDHLGELDTIDSNQTRQVEPNE